jgi:hypothetical protein
MMITGDVLLRVTSNVIGCAPCDDSPTQTRSPTVLEGLTLVLLNDATRPPHTRNSKKLSAKTCDPFAIAQLVHEAFSVGCTSTHLQPKSLCSGADTPRELRQYQSYPPTESVVSLSRPSRRAQATRCVCCHCAPQHAATATHSAQSATRPHGRRERSSSAGSLGPRTSRTSCPWKTRQLRCSSWRIESQRGLEGEAILKEGKE